MSDIDKAIAAINTQHQWLGSYILSLLPAGWTMSSWPRALKNLRDPELGPIVVHSAIARADGLRCGAKVYVVDARSNLEMIEDLGARLADDMRRAAEKHARDGSPVMRFALEGGGRMPTRGSDFASGYDLYAPEDVYLPSGSIVVIHSGVRLQIPDGHEVQVRGRSSMSKRGLLVQLGTIDQDYRGVIGATIHNATAETQQIKAGHRIAQLVIARVEHPPWQQVEASELDETKRGSGGFGSSGQ